MFTRITIIKMKEDGMLSEFMIDEVTIIKMNGERIEGVKASVQSRKIFIDRSDILIEPNDLIERRMSNGGKETYRVVNPGFYEEMFGHPAHYQITHEKIGVTEKVGTPNVVNYNVSGNNTRVNVNSIDNSSNVVNEKQEIFEHLDMLRQEIRKVSDNKKEHLEIIDAIQGQFESEKPSKSVVGTLVKALPNIASITSIVGFLMGCL